MIDLLLPTVFWPLLIGALIGVLATIAGEARRQWLLALLLPLGAFADFVLLEGWPSFPPVGAKHKLPILLVVVALLCFAGGVAKFKGDWPMRGIVALIVVAACVAWIGQTVVLGNLFSARTAWASALAMICVVGLTFLSGDRDSSAPTAVMTPASFFWQAVSGAIATVLAPYVGAAQMLGAWAALLGGFLIVGYIGVLSGRRHGLSTPVAAAFAAGLVTFLLLLMPMLFAPDISHSALVISAASFLVIPLAERFGPANGALNSALRPIVLGLLPAVASLLAVVVAVSSATK